MQSLRTQSMASICLMPGPLANIVFEWLERSGRKRNVSVGWAPDSSEVLVHLYSCGRQTWGWWLVPSHMVWGGKPS